MSDEVDTSCTWDLGHEVSVSVEWDEWAVKNTVKLLEEECTIPFIARYRKELTRNMDVDKLREVNEKMNELKTVQAKVSTAMKNINKLGKLTKKLMSSFKSAKNLTEVEHLFAPFKQGSKRTLAERAKELGLEPYALKLIQDPNNVNLKSAVNTEKKGLALLSEVEMGVQHIIADMIAKDKETMDAVRNIYKNAYIMLESCRRKEAAKNSDEAPKTMKKKADPDKFEMYFNFSIPMKYLKPHQVMAINRGENLKILTVKFNIPDKVKHEFIRYCERHWIKRDANDRANKLLQTSIEDAHKRLIEPLMIRQFRAELTKSAEKASIDVFAQNLKRLLLTPPVRGKVVLGVDPGFKNGCKYAVTSSSGKVLDTGVLYLHTFKEVSKSKEISKLKEVIIHYRCDTIAIGNGTACRETETLFTQHISRGTFKPIQVQYCIVNESGASIYSASDEAMKEFPDMDVTLRGAVSIARRLQDPMSELVKIEPKHIGVGMYQHDCPEVKLKTSLDSVIEECVSFTGVDINTCSEFLLRRISGLNPAKVKKILEYRDQCGGFVCRDELRHIKTIGPKTYEQCAGFVRVMPETRAKSLGEKSEATEDVPNTDSPKKGKKRKGAATTGKSKKAKTDKCSVVPNPLDMTSIHPESYHIADKVIERLGVNKDTIGEETFINSVKQYLIKTDEKTLAKTLNVGHPTMSLIVEGLRQKIGHDIREEFDKPLFKQGIVSLNTIKVDSVLTGKVVNNTHFGAFVDVGVESSGLIHSSQINRTLLKGRNALGIGDKVEVKVISVDLNRKRLGLKLLKLCS